MKSYERIDFFFGHRMKKKKKKNEFKSAQNILFHCTETSYVCKCKISYVCDEYVCRAIHNTHKNEMGFIIF